MDRLSWWGISSDIHEIYVWTILMNDVYTGFLFHVLYCAIRLYNNIMFAVVHNP